MFCMKCGEKLPDDAKFCFKCGNKIIKSEETTSITLEKNERKLVAAQCTKCQAPLEVDPSKDAAICPFCGMAYIVTQAINNYNIGNNGNSVNALLKLASDIINVYANGRDENESVGRISESEYRQAKKYLEQAAEKAPENWNVWFLKGILAELQNYNHMDPSPFQEFERAMSTADEDSIRNVILPHIAESEKRYIIFFENAPTYYFSGDCQPIRLAEYWKFFNKFDIAADYAKEASDEWDRLQVIVEKRVAELAMEDTDREEQLEKAVEVMQNYKQRGIDNWRLRHRLDKELSELIGEINRCGIFDGKRKKELESKKALNHQNRHKAEAEWKVIQDEAYEKYKEFTRDPAIQFDYALEKEIESGWKSTFFNSCMYYDDPDFFEIYKFNGCGVTKEDLKKNFYYK